MGNCKVTFAAGSVLAGWGKGKFRDGSQNKCKDDELEFICGATEHALLDNKLYLIPDLLDMQLKANADGAKICYYMISQSPDGTWDFQQDRGILSVFGGVQLSMNYQTLMTSGSPWVLKW